MTRERHDHSGRRCGLPSVLGKSGSVPSVDETSITLKTRKRLNSPVRPKLNCTLRFQSMNEGLE
jgi:hypothetical protein